MAFWLLKVVPGCTQPNVLGVRRWGSPPLTPPLEVCSTETREGLRPGVVDVTIHGGLVCISFGLCIIWVDLSLNLLTQEPGVTPLWEARQSLSQE